MAGALAPARVRWLGIGDNSALSPTILRAMQFTRNDIVSHTNKTTFSRGESYVALGRVLHTQVIGDFIHGEVQGGAPDPYRLSVRVTSGRRGGVDIEGLCDCPVGYNCKHVVAVLLMHLKEAATTPDEATISMPTEIWLRTLAHLPKGALSTALADDKQRPLYVMVPTTRSQQIQLQLCRVRRKNDGTAGVTMYSDFNSLLSRQPATLAPEDEEAIRLMVALRAGTGTVDGVVPAGPIGARLLEQLCARGCLMWADSFAALKNGAMTMLQPGPQRAGGLAWREQDDASGSVALQWVFDDGEAFDHVVPTQPPCYRRADQLGPLMLPPALARVPLAQLHSHVAAAPALRMQERAGVAARLAQQGLAGIVPLPRAPMVRQRNDVVPSPVLDLDTYHVPSGRGVERVDVALLSFDYDGVYADTDSDAVLSSARNGAVELIERDPAAEQAAVAALVELGFAGAGPDWPMDRDPNLWMLPDGAAWLAFVRRDLPRLITAGWKVAVGPDYRYDVLEADDWYAELNEEVEGGNDWFALELGILVEGERHALLPLLVKMIRNAPAEFGAVALAARPEDSDVLVELADGRPVVLPWARVKPILATLGELYFGDRAGSTLRLPYADAARIAELEAAAQLRWLGGERLRELGRKLNDFDGIQMVAPPAGLQAQLRDYQRFGLAWMQFLREYHFAGILADDMGLGKTIQTLAHILAEKEAGRLDAPALVVAPTSVITNWQAEAARFTPGLRVLLLQGKNRKEGFEVIGGADLVLTTYALLARDELALRQHRYHLLVLDEAQYIKNSKSKAAQTVRLLDARHRLCLTGTPVQNHLGELWSQFHFLMPGLLGDAKTFNAEFRKPIEQGGDSLRRELLARRIRPFMLRRTKDKVATELPPKTEIVLPVELGGSQRDLYETVRVAMDRKVRDEIDRKGLAGSQIVVLAALLKLRQVCCDPRLVQPAQAVGSAKLETLLDLLDTLLAEGRRVLVFSQFTSMLALIEAELRARDVPYALLTGSTEDRAAPVTAFQNGAVPVFLISLKAGGVGLNLTAADTVIHYDPWWNPASENQATDRAWRIGQTQPVFVYKLIARGTLEEKIQEMQRRKGELAYALLSGETELGSGIDADDLKAIFAPSPG